MVAASNRAFDQAQETRDFLGPFDNGQIRTVVRAYREGLRGPPATPAAAPVPRPKTQVPNPLPRTVGTHPVGSHPAPEHPAAAEPACR